MIYDKDVENENMKKVRDNRWGGGERNWGGNSKGYSKGWKGSKG